MFKVEGGKLFGIPTAKQYAESAIRYVGYSRQTTGFWQHSLLLVINQITTFLCPKVAEFLTKKMMYALRDKQIKEGTYIQSN